MGYFVPVTLQELDNWVVWRLEDTGKGKPSKVPYSPITGRRASTADRRTWSSYADAVLRLENSDFSGVGFVFTESAGLVFIDLDNCFTPDGEETDFAREIQALFPDTYTEISQSENGLHIICKGVIPKAIKRPEIEVYSWGRYMAFTGNATTPTEPREAQEGINTLLQKYATTEPQRALQRPCGNIATKDIDSLIAVMLNSKNGANLALLYAGEWEKATDRNGKHFPTQSEADMSFLASLNHFCNGNREIILAIWKRSGLYRADKVDRLLDNMLDKAQKTYTGSVTAGKFERSKVTDWQPKRKRRYF